MLIIKVLSCTNLHVCIETGIFTREEGSYRIVQYAGAAA